jgi:transcriptional regulator with XRE-family HTH domain
MHTSSEPPNEDETMSARIKEARQARGWSQQELAERVSVSQPTIVHWEQGTHTPRHLALARLADALGVSRQWLRGDGEPIAARSIEKATISSVQLSPHQTYLTMPLVHVPIFSGPLDRTEIEACLRLERSPIGYVPVSRAIARPIAMRVDDPAVRREFPKGSIAIIDCADKTLVEGMYFLVSTSGAARLRRWGASPQRLEADNLEDVQFLTAMPEILGRAVMSIRHY